MTNATLKLCCRQPKDGPIDVSVHGVRIDRLASASDVCYVNVTEELKVCYRTETDAKGNVPEVKRTASGQSEEILLKNVCVSGGQLLKGIDGNCETIGSISSLLSSIRSIYPRIAFRITAGLHKGQHSLFSLIQAKHVKKTHEKKAKYLQNWFIKTYITDTLEHHKITNDKNFGGFVKYCILIDWFTDKSDKAAEFFKTTKKIEIISVTVGTYLDYFSILKGEIY